MRISLPMQLTGVILFVILCGGMFNTYTVQLCYTFSLLFKELLSLFLPAIVFSFVLSGILSFKKNAPIVLLLLLGSIFLSNAFVALSSYFLITNFLPYTNCIVGEMGLVVSDTIMPLWVYAFPAWVRSEHAMVAAVVLGLLFSWVQVAWVEHVATACRVAV